MEEIIRFLIEQFKEFNMQYGLWETIFAYSILVFVACIAWRLPNILAVIKDWRK